MSGWDTDLRRMANFLMNDPRPAALYWGPNRTMMYNEPYVVVTGHRHPRMMGKSFEDAWQEVAGVFMPLFERVSKSGLAYVEDNAYVFSPIPLLHFFSSSSSSSRIYAGIC